MDISFKIIQFFYKNNNIGFTAQALSENLRLSQEKVYKSLFALKNSGYVYEINKGGFTEYKMSNHDDLLSPQKISYFTLPPVTKENIIVFDNLSSTNDTAKQFAVRGAEDKTIIIAQSQSCGKGRNGRSFYSPKGSGIYMSILHSPKTSPDSGVLITSCSAVAVCRAIEKVCSVSTRIKWVNDIICRGKKVCGILAEALTDSRANSLQYVVTGIGVNCFSFEMPAELAKKAGAVSDKKNFSRNTLCAQIINEFFTISAKIERREFIEEYKQRSAVIGRYIEVVSENHSYVAKAIGIDENCGLKVQTADGSIKTLNSGEVSITGNFYE